MPKNKLVKAEAERRELFLEWRAVENEDGDDVGLIEGVPIVFDQKTDIGGFFSEQIAPGALDKTDLRDVPLLVNHDIDGIPVARSRRNNKNSSMTLTVFDKGLKISAKLDVKNNARAAELYSAIKRGDINGMSFMFSIDGEKWEDENSDYPHRTITSIAKVWEVSAVTFPAYEQTSIGTRTADAEQCRALLDKVRRSAGEQTEDEKEKELLRLKIELECLTV